MRREERLTRASHFAAVFRGARGWGGDMAVLKALPNGLAFSRFGFVVSKKVSKKAVVRNRVRRLLREIIRETPVDPGWDVVIIARPAAVETGYWQLRRAMITLLGRAGILGGGR